MREHAFWINMVVGICLGLGVCCLVAAFLEPFRLALSSIFSIFYRPVSQILDSTMRYLRRLRQWLLSQIEDESERKGDGPIYFVIGALLYSLLTGIYLLCDFGLVVLTVQAMGMDESSLELPVDTSTITAAALVTASVFWGAVLFDLLGVTRLAPWRKSLSGTQRKLFIGIALSFSVLSFSILGLMAYWRGVSLQVATEAQAVTESPIYLENGGLELGGQDGLEPGANQIGVAIQDESPPSTSYDWILPACMIGIAIVSAGAAMFSMVGLGILAKFCILAIISISALILLPVAFSAWMISTLLSWILNALQCIIDLLAQIGSSFLGLFGWRSRQSEIPTDNRSEQIPQTHETNEEQETDAGAYSGPVDPGFNPFPRRQL